MRVWWFNQFAVPPTAAGGTRHWSLARSLNDAGHDVTLVAGSGAYMQRCRTAGTGVRCLDGVRFAFVPALRPGDSGAARILEMLYFGAGAAAVSGRLRRAGVAPADVVIGSTPAPPAALAGLRVARRLGVPFLLEVRDLWPDSLIQLGRFGTGHPYIRALAWAQQRLLAGARGVISVLPRALDVYGAHGVPPDRVCVVPNGVDLGLAPAPRPEPPLGPPERPLRVLYAGAHGVANGLESVLDAAERVEARAPGTVRFEFLGDGPRKAALRARAAARNQGNVVFRDAVPKHAVYDELAGAHVLLMPLRRADVFAHGVSPNKLWDYFAAARPVIFAVNASNDPVRALDAGRSVPPEDPEALAGAVLELSARTPAERSAMGARGRAWVEAEHDNRRLAERLAGFLDRCTGGPIPARAAAPARGPGAAPSTRGVTACTR